MLCDSHVHVVGPIATHPQAANRTYIADVAPVDTLQRLGIERGFTRFVIVQPSFYGTDNSVTLKALDDLNGNGRGVAVIDPNNVTPEQLADFHQRGVRGLRMNLYSPIKAAGTKSLGDSFSAMAHVARDMKWHVQVIAPLGILLESEDILAQSPVPVVIDHYGVYGKSRPDSGEGRRLLGLMHRPHVWMKLSAPYRLDDGPLSTQPDRAWISALIEAAPDRCIWGSDWPHPPPHEWHKGGDTVTPYRELSYNELVDNFVAALPSDKHCMPVLRDNPARLYGF